MRTAKRNQIPMKYALFLKSVEIPEVDTDGNPEYYVDKDGNKHYIYTGQKEDIYTEPIDFSSNIAMAGGEAEAMEYGLSINDYEAKIIYPKNAYPIVEGSLIWVSSEPKYEDEEEKTFVVNGEVYKTKVIDKTSSDYRCIKISDSLNFTVAILKATNK